VGLVLVVTFGVLDSGDPDAADPMSSRVTTSAVPAEALTLDGALAIDPSAVGTEEARVERIIDGDTLVVQLAGRRETIRLFGLQAPERERRCYEAAGARLASLAPPGSTVLLHPGPRNDDGQRLLRYMFSTDGVSMDATLVSEGLAEAWHRDGQLRETIEGLEMSAQTLGRGCLWRGGEGGGDQPGGFSVTISRSR